MTDNPRLAAALDWSRRNKHCTRPTPPAREVRRVRRAALALITRGEAAPGVYAYDRTRAFSRRERVAHPSFGRGVVTEVRGTKMTVRFGGGGQRVLLHALAG